MGIEAGTKAGELELVVAGAHLHGQPLNHQLTDLGARFVESTTTSPDYRMFALATEPAKPGLVRVPGDGAAMAVEAWALSPAALGTFLAALPAPMALGRVELADGREATGFLVEPYAVAGAEDITAYGGWAAYRARGTDAGRGSGVDAGRSGATDPGGGTVAPRG